MKRFLGRVILFLSPIIIVLICISPFGTLLVKTGELLPIDNVIDKQRDNPDILIGLAYNEQTAYYKIQNARYYQPQVLALGTSRVMQFKRDYFISDFYNCGGAVYGTYWEYTNFVKNLDYTPELIIVGIDTWYFSERWNDNLQQSDTFYTITPIKRGNISIIRACISDYYQDKWNFKDVNNYSNNIGFNGTIKDAGFMYDGSYYYGNIYRDETQSPDYHFINSLEMIKANETYFAWHDEVNEDTLTALKSFLKYCKSQRIEVVGFICPYAPTVYDALIQNGSSEFFAKIENSCMDIFAENDFELYNYIDGRLLDMSDEYFLDGFHGSDVVYAHILLDMAGKKSVITQYIDENEIDNLIDNAYSTKSIVNPFSQ